MIRGSLLRLAPVAFVAVVVLIGSPDFASAQCAGTSWTLDGTLKLKIQKVGSEKFGVPSSALRFGPQMAPLVLGANEFAYIVDDGLDTLTTTGTYTCTTKGKAELNPNNASVASDIEDLVAPELPPGVAVQIGCESKLKAKIKTKKNLIKAKGKWKCLVSAAGESLKLRMLHKGGGGMR